MPVQLFRGFSTHRRSYPDPRSLNDLLPEESCSSLCCCRHFLTGNVPDVSDQLPSHRYAGHLGVLPRFNQQSIARAETFLSTPGNRLRALARMKHLTLQVHSFPCGKSIAPRRLDQDTSSMRVPCSGDTPLASCAATTMLGRDQTKIGHQIRRLLEPSEVSQFREKYHRRHGIDPFQSCQ